MSKKNKPQIGQYFTTNPILQNKIIEFIKNKPKCILEPCVGRGDLVVTVHYENKDIKFDMYEIDNKINFINDYIKNNVVIGDFLLSNSQKKYKTIIGNPPYIRTKKGNLYIDFIEKCVNMLENKGELIFVIPSDFFKLTGTKQLLSKMLLEGTFTHIYHPHNEKMFENAIIDILIFRYCKDKNLEKIVIYNDKKMEIRNSNGLVTFENEIVGNNIKTLGDYFDIYVGIVTAKEEVFKNQEFGNVSVINGKNKIEKYIYLGHFPTNNENLNKYMLENKEKLMSRKIRKFSEKNWYEWGAPRNIKIMEEFKGRKCIYVRSITRKQEVAFEGEVGYCGGSLVMMIPKNSGMELGDVIKYLNSGEFKGKYMYSGRFRIGHRQLYNSIWK